MRHVWIAVTCLCLRVLPALAETPAPEARPALQLAVFVGSWTFKGEVKAGPLSPGSKVSGTETSRKLGDAFVERHFTEMGSGRVRKGVHVFGYDPVKAEYITSDFDSTGGFGTGTVSLSGRIWAFKETRVGGGKPFSNRCDVTFAPGNRSFTVACEVSTDGSSWAPSFTGTWTKTK